MYLLLFIVYICHVNVNTSAKERKSGELRH